MKRNFTLLELLIVVGVIAILTGLLAPALNAARDKATSISCVGNLKQIGFAYASYVSDWNFTPTVKYTGVQIRWVDLLEPHLAKKSEKRTGNIFVCPADRRPEDKLAVSGTVDTNKLSYGMNQCYSKGHDGGNEDKPWKLWYGVNANLIRSPSEFISAADAKAYYVGTTISAPAYAAENGELVVNSGFALNLSFRHDAVTRRFNASYLDGHVAGLKFDSTPYRYWDLQNKWDGTF